MNDRRMQLPPGFQFRPTDEELVLHYLYHKAALLPCHPDIIPDLGFRLYNPWEYSGKAFSSGNVYYFFNKVRENNRATESGYWEDLGIDEPIFSRAGKKVGIKKCFVFYITNSPMATKTAWILQEYHLSNYFLDSGSWVLCLVHECKGSSATAFCSEVNNDEEVELSFMDDMFLSFDDDVHDVITFPT